MAEQPASHTPLPPDDGSDALPYARGAACLVRLGVEFDLPDELKEARYYYLKTYCRVTVTADREACLPTVLDVYPDHLFEGGPRMMKVELKPELTLSEVGGSFVWGRSQWGRSGGSASRSSG